MWNRPARAAPPPAFFILLSADVAAMAQARVPALLRHHRHRRITIGVDETLRKKITNDAMAFLRS